MNVIVRGLGTGILWGGLALGFTSCDEIEITLHQDHEPGGGSSSSSGGGHCGGGGMECPTGCESTMMERVLEPSHWGGEQIELNVSESTATSSLDFSCASGAIPGPIGVDGCGRFRVFGTYTPGPGGAMPICWRPTVYRILYEGTITGDEMDLKMTFVGIDPSPGIAASGQGPMCVPPPDPLAAGATITPAAPLPPPAHYVLKRDANSQMMRCL